MKNGVGPKTMVIGLVLGVLSVPALVLAATTAFGPDDDVDALEASTTTMVVASTIPDDEPTTTSTTLDTGTDAAEDLADACGDDGLALVMAEADGSITEIQQAALDALRPICEEAGLALPAPTAPSPVVVETVVETVIEASSGPAASAPTGGYEDDDHDDDDDHDEDDHEDEDDDHDEDDEDDDEDHEDDD